MFQEPQEPQERRGLGGCSPRSSRRGGCLGGRSPRRWGWWLEPQKLQEPQRGGNVLVAGAPGAPGEGKGVMAGAPGAPGKGGVLEAGAPGAPGAPE